jgi:hypothetical protein
VCAVVVVVVVVVDVVVVAAAAAVVVVVRFMFRIRLYKCLTDYAYKFCKLRVFHGVLTGTWQT